MEDYKKLLKRAFREVLATPEYEEDTVDRYFSPEYIQQVDGKELGLKQFKKHVKVLKESMASMVFDFRTMVQENDIVFSNHCVRGVTKEGREGVMQVIAEFHFRDGRIVYCSELTHLLSGDPHARDLGSRH